MFQINYGGADLLIEAFIGIMRDCFVGRRRLLYKIRENMGFCIALIFSQKDRIANSDLTQENTGHRILVVWHI